MIAATGKRLRRQQRRYRLQQNSRPPLLIAFTIIIDVFCGDTNFANGILDNISKELK